MPMSAALIVALDVDGSGWGHVDIKCTSADNKYSQDYVALKIVLHCDNHPGKSKISWAKKFIPPGKMWCILKQNNLERKDNYWTSKVPLKQK